LSAYLVWHFAVAYYVNRGPVIWIGEIEPIYLDPGFFQFVVANVHGMGVVVLRPYAEDPRDKKGRKLDRIDQEIELHCRGYYVGDKVKLIGDARAKVAFLHVRKDEELNMTCLFFPVPAPRPPADSPGGIGLLPLISDDMTPLEYQDKLFLPIRVDLFDEGGNTLLARRRLCMVVIPDESSPLKYRVRPARWWMLERRYF
jgi:hypothetical protein